ELALHLDQSLVLLRVRRLLEDLDAALLGPVQILHHQATLVATVDLGLERGQVDLEDLGVDELEHEGPPAAEHAHVDVLASGAVEAVLARAEGLARDPADQLLDRVPGQLAETLAARTLLAPAR